MYEYFDPLAVQPHGTNSFSWTAALLIDVIENAKIRDCKEAGTPTSHRIPPHVEAIIAVVFAACFALLVLVLRRKCKETASSSSSDGVAVASASVNRSPSGSSNSMMRPIHHSRAGKSISTAEVFVEHDSDDEVEMRDPDHPRYIARRQQEEQQQRRSASDDDVEMHRSNPDLSSSEYFIDEDGDERKRPQQTHGDYTRL
eukprot:TRINITY_DN60107_c0_g2_i1.p1 TRINITY_DN60107_c0_g2~~TRINITY_DN60107_c0_g2_i1.p1  ORF type:complete len:200 (+),score=111.76 TRINITY_DN60107_c0_g2_i1:3-602(+)